MDFGMDNVRVGMDSVRGTHPMYCGAGVSDDFAGDVLAKAHEEQELMDVTRVKVLQPISMLDHDGQLDGPAHTAGAVYYAFNRIEQVDRAEGVASALISYLPGLNVTLFTERQLWHDFWSHKRLTRGVGTPFTSVAFVDDVGRDVEVFGGRWKPSGGEGGKAAGPLGAHALQWARKMFALFNSPYDLTLFMQTDTCFCGRYVEHMFALLEEHDIALPKNPNGRQGVARDESCKVFDPVPHLFEERITSLVLYRRGVVVSELFRRWADIFMRQVTSAGGGCVRGEHASLTEALYGMRRQPGLVGSVLEDARIVDRAELRREDHKVKEYSITNSKEVCARGEAGAQWGADECNVCRREGVQGPGCASGCLVVHEKCECWTRRPLADAPPPPSPPSPPPMPANPDTLTADEYLAWKADSDKERKHG